MCDRNTIDDAKELRALIEHQKMVIEKQTEIIECSYGTLVFHCPHCHHETGITPVRPG